MKTLIAVVLALAVLQATAVPLDVNEAEVDRPARWGRYCDQSYYNNSGVITSPNYPQDYDNNLDCDYVINPTLYGRYEMRFYLCDFDVEASVFGGCSDWVDFNGTQRICGIQLGEMKFMGTGFFELKFHTDWRTTRRGFRIAYCAGCYNWNAVSAMCRNRRSRLANTGWQNGYFPNGSFGNGWPNITRYNQSQHWGWPSQ
ncbi:cubilin-like [Liolophura sinensis]|uniref:cubilin-like n=1 Tax=Liolophura sinensis TaxID=3198878 RepID=UPI0031593BBD